MPSRTVSCTSYPIASEKSQQLGFAMQCDLFSCICHSDEVRETNNFMV